MGDGSAKICRHCQEHHEKVLTMFAGAPPPGCQECGVTFETLRALPNGDVRMFLHMKDNIYQLLCPVCSDRYVAKRRDLYGPATFGRSLGLAA